MTAVEAQTPTAGDAKAAVMEKRIATLAAHAALAGKQLVAIESDDGGIELLLTEGAATQRFHDQEAALAAIVAWGELR